MPWHPTNILHEAKNLSKKKPVVISMSDEAASGGYYVAVTGDPDRCVSQYAYRIHRRDLRALQSAWSVRQNRA